MVFVRVNVLNLILEILAHNSSICHPYLSRLWHDPEPILDSVLLCFMLPLVACRWRSPRCPTSIFSPGGRVCNLTIVRTTVVQVTAETVLISKVLVQFMFTLSIVCDYSHNYSLSLSRTYLKSNFLCSLKLQPKTLVAKIVRL